MEAANLRDGGFSVGCIVPGHESQPRGAEEESLLMLTH